MFTYRLEHITTLKLQSIMYETFMTQQPFKKVEILVIIAVAYQLFGGREQISHRCRIEEKSVSSCSIDSI